MNFEEISFGKGFFNALIMTKEKKWDYIEIISQMTVQNFTYVTFMNQKEVDITLVDLLVERFYDTHVEKEGYYDTILDNESELVIMERGIYKGEEWYNRTKTIIKPTTKKIYFKEKNKERKIAAY